MMKLYYVPKSRGARPRWIMEELGLPYELIRLDMQKQEHKSPAFMKIHPLGQVPAMTIDDKPLFESAAMCTYLADKFLDKGLAPALDSELRAEYFQWIFFAVATFEPPTMGIFYHTLFLPEERRIPQMVTDGQATFRIHAALLNEHLKNRTYLLGDQFTTPDVLIGSLLVFVQQHGMLNDFPALQHYCNRLSERPAFLRANAD